MGTGLVLGFFDGVHKGHKTVINSATHADKIVVLTFSESPAKFFDKNVRYVLSRQNSIKKIKQMGVSEIVLQDFDKIRTISAEDYIKKIIEQYRPESISTGFNYTFGKNKAGNADLLKECAAKYNYKYICVEPQIFNDEVISSTLIKNYLKKGSIREANRLLESNFIIEGVVKKGMQLGRKIGFPTANIEYPDDITEIPYGVYFVKVNTYTGIMNYGIKPTINNKNKPLAEVHILNYNGDLYGKNISVEVLDKIRDEQKFDSLEDLKRQIHKDKEACLKLSL